MIDMVVHRRELRSTVAKLLTYLAPAAASPMEHPADKTTVTA